MIQIGSHYSGYSSCGCTGAVTGNFDGAAEMTIVYGTAGKGSANAAGCHVLIISGSNGDGTGLIQDQIPYFSIDNRTEKTGRSVGRPCYVKVTDRMVIPVKRS